MSFDMERTLLWIAFGLGWLTWICSLLLSRSKDKEARSSLPSLYYTVMAGLPVLIFIASFPSKPPFAEGQGLGKGFLIGGVLALVASWTVNTSYFKRSAEARPAVLVTAPYALAVIASSIPILFLQQTLIDSLLGVLIGWFCVSLVGILGLLVTEKKSVTEDRMRGSRAFALISGIGFAVAVGLIAALGEYRGNVASTSGGAMISWSGPALLITALVPLILLVNALPVWMYARLSQKIPLWPFIVRSVARLFPYEDQQQAAGGALRLTTGALLFIVFVKLVTWKVIAQSPVFQISTLGVLIMVVAWWMMASPAVKKFPQQNNLFHQNPTIFGTLLVLSGLMVAYQLLAGLGIALFCVAAWLVVGLAWVTEQDNANNSGPDYLMQGLTTGSRLIAATLFATLMGLYRLYLSRYGDELHGISITDQYAFFSLMVGLSVPLLMSGIAMPSLKLTSLSSLLRVSAVGIFCLLIPGVMLVLWGAKCSLALLMGLAFSTLLTGFSRPASGSTEEQNRLQSASLLPTLMALAMGLALTQWTGHVLPFTDVTRDAKIGLLKWIAGIVILLVIILQASNRSDKGDGVGVATSTGAAS